MFGAIHIEKNRNSLILFGSDFLSTRLSKSFKTLGRFLSSFSIHLKRNEKKKITLCKEDDTKVDILLMKHAKY
jgi:hypothetical protein